MSPIFSTGLAKGAIGGAGLASSLASGTRPPCPNFEICLVVNAVGGVHPNRAICPAVNGTLRGREAFGYGIAMLFLSSLFGSDGKSIIGFSGRLLILLTYLFVSSSVEIPVSSERVLIIPIAFPGRWANSFGAPSIFINPQVRPPVCAKFVGQRSIIAVSD